MCTVIVISFQKWLSLVLKQTESEYKKMRIAIKFDSAVLIVVESLVFYKDRFLTAEQEIGVQEIKGIETLMRCKMGKKEKKGYLRNTDGYLRNTEGSTPLQVLISPDRSDTSCILWFRVESNWIYSIICLTLIGTIS